MDGIAPTHQIHDVEEDLTPKVTVFADGAFKEVIKVK